MITSLSILTVVAQVVALLLAASWALSRVARGARVHATVRRWVGPDATRLAWLVAVVATSGSLYMSHVRHFPPCELCWFQRIAMYPLVVVLGIAAVRGDHAIRLYAIPLALLGAGVSAYHVQLERFPDQHAIACSSTVPCTTVWFERFGYVTIPMMALSAFALIVLVLTLGGPDGQGRPQQA